MDSAGNQIQILSVEGHCLNQIVLDGVLHKIYTSIIGIGRWGRMDDFSFGFAGALRLSTGGIIASLQRLRKWGF